MPFPLQICRLARKVSLIWHQWWFLFWFVLFCLAFYTLLLSRLSLTLCFSESKLTCSVYFSLWETTPILLPSVQDCLHRPDRDSHFRIGCMHRPLQGNPLINSTARQEAQNSYRSCDKLHARVEISLQSFHLPILSRSLFTQVEHPSAENFFHLIPLPSQVKSRLMSWMRHEQT